ncbi:hypothetical protein ABEB36_015702, partial [Hypothenemus hampei]
ADNISDDEFQCIAPITKAQFEELFSYCDPIIQNGQFRNIRRKNLLTFFSRQVVSSVINNVRRSLSERFVRENMGPVSIIRQNYIFQHITVFSNVLCSPEPNEARAIAIGIAPMETFFHISRTTEIQSFRQFAREPFSIRIVRGPLCDPDMSRKFLHLL